MKEYLGPFAELKALCHADRYGLLLSGRLPPPVTMEVDLTDGFCNQNCPRCFYGTGQKHEPVLFPLARAERLAREFADAGVKAVLFPGGGEPTTHPQFSELIDAFWQSGLPLGLATNGVLWRRLLPVVHKFRWIRVSLDAGTPSDYEQSHGTAAFPLVVEGIRELAQCAHQTVVGVGFLVTPENWPHAEEAITVAYETRASYIQFRAAAKANWCGRADLHDVVSLMSAIGSRHHGVPVYVQMHKWYRILHGRSVPSCETSPLAGVVKADGSIPFCCLKRDEPESHLGSVFEQDFASVWFSSEHERSFRSRDHHACPLPCKFDMYNEIFFALRDGKLAECFL